MSDKDTSLLSDAMAGAAQFGKFVPGFDFLQNLAKGAATNIPQLPNPANWIAPTLNVEELDRRVSELKAVHFWLDQNAKALGATIQALEVQKMTLATLRGMNFNMGDVANALKLKASETVAEKMMGAGLASTPTAPTRAKAAAGGQRASSKSSAGAGSAAGVPDPMQWWGQLTKQFTEIAGNAMKDASRQSALDTTKNFAQAGLKTATGMASQAVKNATQLGSQQMQAQMAQMEKFTSMKTNATKKVAKKLANTPAKRKKS
jgi:hypothetical protein